MSEKKQLNRPFILLILVALLSTYYLVSIFFQNLYIHILTDMIAVSFAMVFSFAILVPSSRKYNWSTASLGIGIALFGITVGLLGSKFTYSSLWTISINFISMWAYFSGAMLGFDFLFQKYYLDPNRNEEEK